MRVPPGFPSGRRRPVVSPRLAGVLHQRRVTQGEEAAPSLALSSMTVDDWDVAADGSTEATLALTLRDTNGDLMPARAITRSYIDTSVDADETTFTTDLAEIAETTGTANLALVVLNADGIALPNIPAAQITVTSTGSNNTITKIDSATDHNGRMRVTFSSTTAETKTLSAEVIGLAITATVEIEVTGTPTLPVLDGHWDWSTATGTSDAAVRDTDKSVPLTAQLDSANGLEVVVAATGPAGFSSTNILRVTCKQANAGTQRVYVTGLPAITDGQSLYIRYEDSVEQALFTDTSQHPVESGQTGGFAFAINTVVDADDGKYWHNIQAVSEGGVRLWAQHWRCPKLDKSTVYRKELQIERVSSTSCRFHARVYDSSGVLLYDDDDFTNAFTSDGVPAGSVSMAAGTVVAGNMSQLSELRFGVNGLSNSDWHPETLYAYQACGAVSRDRWCGAYDPVNG